MSDQLRLHADTGAPSAARYTIEQHDQTKRLWAMEWDRATGDITGTSGPIPADLTQADLAALTYERNPLIVATARRDMLDQRYTTYTPDEELA